LTAISDFIAESTLGNNISERSIVRVSIYQSNQPQHISPPDYLAGFEENLDNSLSNYNIEEIMTTSSTIPGYDRQQSTDSGWDNPFRPGGDLSREADEIVNMIRGGKPITPIEDHSIGNGNAQKEEIRNGNSVNESVTKTNVTQQQTAQNGTNKVQQTTKSSEAGTTSLAQVSKQVVPGPTSASHVVIDEKKNKKKGCCVIQ